MRFYRHRITTTDLFILVGDAPEWLNTYVDGRYSKERRTPMYCRLVPTGEIALVHTARWAYNSYLSQVSEAEARRLDCALVDRIAGIERGKEVPRLIRTKHYGYMQEALQ